MTSPRTRTTILVLASLLAVLAAAWGALALWVQFPAPPPRRILMACLWVAAMLALLVLAWQGRSLLPLIGHVLLLALLAAWWLGIQPSNTRDWADDVSRPSTGEIHGDIATLRDVRNFDWRTATDYTPRWETRQYDLSTLRDVDMILSYWTIEPIAHTLVSFGFENGERVVFSVEIRKERHESFSALGGFFKQFEASVIAADERDIVRVRSNVRNERVFLYKVQMPQPVMRSLFAAYVEEANRLSAEPRFYNTLTENCTTIVYGMMRRLVGGLPMNWRLLASGYLPAYVHARDALAPGVALDVLRERGHINARAHAAGDAPDFSQRIRAGVPGY